MRFALTGGQRGDCPKAYALIEGLPAQAVMADTAYDADCLRQAVASKGALAVIPSNPSSARKHPLDKHLYAQRHLIECCFSALKQIRRVATRFEKTAELPRHHHPRSHHPMAQISVHRTQGLILRRSAAEAVEGEAIRWRTNGGSSGAVHRGLPPAAQSATSSPAAHSGGDHLALPERRRMTCHERKSPGRFTLAGRLVCLLPSTPASRWRSN